MKPFIVASDKSWIEGNAIRQLEQTAELPGVETVVAMPDLHVSKGCAVGSVVFTRDVVYPHLIGNDYGCGFSVFQTSIPTAKHNLAKLAARLVGLDSDWRGEVDHFLESCQLQGAKSHTLGTVGGGNHFAELQKISTITDDSAFASSGLNPDFLILLVHSGSRSVGEDLWQKYAAICGAKGFAKGIKECLAYLEEQEVTLRWSQANRRLIANRFLDLLDSDCQFVLDLPHNFVERHEGGFLHRKGAAPSNRGLSPLPGSRGTYTYLLKPLANDRALQSLAHGAGRKISRSSMHGRTGRSIKDLRQTPFGGLIVCGDDILLEEEHHTAYKSVDQVLSDLKLHNMATDVAILTPVLTYKSADSKLANERSKKEKEIDWRRERHRHSR